MKMKLLLSLLLLGALPAFSLEERTFHSADKSKSFVGEATAYSSATDTVTVQREGGKELTFKLSLLCEEDQAYIRENSVVLTAAGNVRVEMKEYEGDRQTNRTDTTRLAVTPTGFIVTVANAAKEPLEDVTADYTIYYRKGSESGDSKLHESTGTMDLYTIYPRNRFSDRTGTVNLERFTRSKSGGG